MRTCGRVIEPPGVPHNAPHLRGGEKNISKVFEKFQNVSTLEDWFCNILWKLRIHLACNDISACVSPKSMHDSL